MRRRSLFLTTVALLVAASSVAKMFEEPRSFRLTDKSLTRIDRKVLPEVNLERLREEAQKEDKNRERPRPFRFAVSLDVSFTLANSGTWQALPDGRLWRLRIHSPRATSHNLGITKFEMTQGAKLWIYDPGRKRVDGPYTARNRSHRGSLWTPVVLGDEIVVEIFVPSGVAQPTIEIRKVNQGFRGFLKDDIPGGGTPGACEIDVICPEGVGWDQSIDPVGVYTVSGAATCTGALLNNTSIDFTPYFLSANHCSVDGTNDDTVVVYWNFEAPICDTHTGGSIAENQSGSTFRASSATSDFLLIELDDKPRDLGYVVWYAGWDATGVVPAAAVGVHHPQCGVKSISFATPSSSSANFWRADWNTPAADPAVTEPGSSGSPLYDAATQRVIGQLQGGPSACGASAANLHDFYGKFSVSWTGDGTNATRLSNWLDPGGTGVTTFHGDPHATTLDGVHYDFQGAGEYVALRSPDGMEIQTRMTPVATTFTPGADPYDGLATCVSLTSALAARVNEHRVSIQPNLSGLPDPSGLQVHVDGRLVSVGSGINLGAGGRITRAATGEGYEIDFANGTTLTATPLYWNSQGKWYMNVDVMRGGGTSGIGGASSDAAPMGGIMAALAPESWLPPLPDGSSIGPMPATLHERYVVLYQKFGEAWRVTKDDSLFEYAPGTSTDTFTLRSWPPEKPPCEIPQEKPAKPLDAREAARLCRGLEQKAINADCTFDVTVTGEPGFAKLYRLSQRIRTGATRTTVELVKAPSAFVATVTARTSGRVPAGAVQFFVDGERAGAPVRLDDRGRAMWTAPSLRPGKHTLVARYVPPRESPLLPSSSHDRVITIER